MWKRLRWLGVRLLAAVAAWVILYSAANYHLTRQHEEALAWFDANGIPTRPQEFVRPPVDPKDDAGPLWRAAGEMANAVDLQGRMQALFWRAELKDGRFVAEDVESHTAVQRPMTEAELTQLRTFLADNRVILDLLHEAAMRPGYHSPIDYGGEYWYTGRPVTQHALQLARCAQLAAEVTVLDGHTDEAVQYWASQRALERWPAEEPMMVCQCLCTIIEDRLCASVQQGLRCGIFSEGELARVAAVLEPVSDYHRRCRLATTGELSVNLCPGMRSVLTGEPRREGWPPSVPAAGVMRLLVLNDQNRIMNCFRDIGQWLETDCRPCEAPWEISSYSFLLNPVTIVNAVAKAEAARRVTAWGVACQRHRLATGAYPAALADLGSEFTAGLGKPIDPFTGKPLAYRPIERDGRAAGFLLYSVGPNLKDESGPSAQAGDDIAFSLGSRGIF